MSSYGTWMLYSALICAILQSFVPTLGYRFKNVYALALVRPAAYAQCAFVSFAYLFLTLSFVTNDFTNLYVAANAHRSLPFFYKVTALWGAHEGSILLWLLTFNIWSVFFSITRTETTLQVLTLIVLGFISVGFLSFLLLTSNPFITTAIPLPGQDLNPLLQDPGFVIHPPLLYMGYVGMSVAFAITFASLIKGQLDYRWARLTRFFTIAAWCFLTLGIILGSWWAYRVLGWGGFWFWDPVENASLLPWISSLALIHLLILVEKRGAAVAWTSLVALITFSLSLLGTFLVRSGVLVSAHTFANDPSRGIFLLVLLFIFYTAAISIYLIRISQMIPLKIKSSFFSRESKLLLNSAILFLTLLTILLGTLYPLIMDALHLGSLSVGAPYFNQALLPIVLFSLFIMGLIPFVEWQSKNKSNLNKKNIFIKLCYSLLIASLLLYFTVKLNNFTAWIALTFIFWVFFSLYQAKKIFSAINFAHGGFALMILGIVLSNLLSIERVVKIAPGHATKIGPYQFFFIDTEKVTGTNYNGIRAIFEVIKNKRVITKLYPEKRIYTVRDLVMTKVAIQSALFRDLYLALGEPLDKEAWSVRIYYKPCIRFIWLGGLFMILGGLIALINFRWNKKCGSFQS